MVNHKMWYLSASFLVKLEGFFLRKRSAITNPLFGFSSLIKTKKDT